MQGWLDTGERAMPQEVMPLHIGIVGCSAEASIAELQAMVRALKAEGCDAVVLGCTELPLVLGDHNAALPTLDSTRLLARAALRRAVRSG
jgi:aspartate racemase